MKKQILNQKTRVLIFIALLFVYGLHGISYAGLEFAEGDTTTREIAENTPKCRNIGVPLRYSAEEAEDCIDIWLRGPDARSFAITLPFRGGVQLRTKSALNYEKKNSYQVTLSITDMEEPEDTDIITVNISVTDVNERPVFSEQMEEAAVNRVRRSIPENTPLGTSIGPPVSASDPDGSDVVLTYSLSGYDADMFEIDSRNGQLKTKASLDYEAFGGEDPTYFVKVIASDGMTSTEIGVAIIVEPVNEFAPVFYEANVASREVVENSSGGVNVGAPLLATDGDVGDTLEYRLSEEDITAGIFEIDSTTGQLSTKIALNSKTKSCYLVTVYASDGIHETGLVVSIDVLPAIVKVPDRSLATMIRRTLDINASDDITAIAMLQLTILDADGDSRLAGLAEIEDLTGLEHAKNLTTLLLTSNSVSDLTPLQGLTKLTTLEIYGNKVVFLTPLKDLTNLTKLQLGYNWIHDITPLTGLTNLTELYLRSNNRIKDITALKDLTNLRILNLSENLIKDIKPLKELTNLRTLHLRHNNRLTDISPLAGLVNLETLGLRGCPITDFSPLESLTADIDVLD